MSRRIFPWVSPPKWVECQPLLALICHRWLDCSAEPQMRVTRLNNHFLPCTSFRFTPHLPSSYGRF
ncbi:hypothetical protein IG631_04035 [Alternaria alternata]|nr:hypothetical protein IG631_04035 [Alternaria alternata]